MCGIAGVFNQADAQEKVVEALSFLQNRGKDGAGLADGAVQHRDCAEELAPCPGRHALGHVLHAVVNQVPQPLMKKGTLTLNGEIYNWNELKKTHSLSSENDAEAVLDLLDTLDVSDILDHLDGVYAFAYWNKGKVWLARDILGVKPLFYTTERGLAFASEKKALIQLGYTHVEELNPRTLLCYDIEQNALKKMERPFFKSHEKACDQQTIKRLLLEAVKKRIPDTKLGILFSGGIDSTVLAWACKQLGKEFTCYTSAFEKKGMEAAQDLVWAKRVAEKLDFPLKIVTLSLEETRQAIAEIAPLIEDTNVVKIGVGVTMEAACRQAEKDGVKVIFSGLGSEEIFAGYERHKHAQDINKECRSGLLKIYERDCYRDDTITMHHGIELRLPFLDKQLVEAALGLPAEEKLSGIQNKIILRRIAEELGIPQEFAQRKKTAAQYGSKFDRAIQQLAKKEGYKRKSAFLHQFYIPPNVRLGVLWSGGKDSAFAAYTMQQQGYSLGCLIALKSENPDSYMFHTPAIDLVGLHAEAMNLPLIMETTKGIKEEELQDLKRAIQRAKEEQGIQGIVTGALYSNYQRDRVEQICDALDLKIFSPLWHISQEQEMRDLLEKGFRFVFTKVAGLGLDQSWLGREITHKDIDALVRLHEKIGIHIAGEGGETESLVLSCPLFAQEIRILDSSIIQDGEHTAILQISSAKLT